MPELEEAISSAQDIHHNLPVPTTPFIGRQRELGEVQRLLLNPQTRVVTILAPGGMGKTRLALEVAGMLMVPSQQTGLYHFPDGGYLVELAAVDDAADILNSIAEAVGCALHSGATERRQQLAEFFRSKRLLLVLDNFEHVRSGAALLGDLLKSAAHLKILVTSRETLALNGEIVYPLLGMDYPDGQTAQAVMDYTAAQLFLQRARRVAPMLELRPDDEQPIARICQLMEGMPLGIELAAAWVNVLSIDEIVHEITRNLGFLHIEHQDIAPRQWSMRAVIDYSWTRLTEAEQRYLMELSIFRGGFTRQAAEAVVEIDLLTLRSLAEKSLISRNSSGRYSLHELLRRYAEEKLEGTGLGPQLNAIYCDYFAKFLQQRQADIKGNKQLAALAEIRAEVENIWLAWNWAVANQHYTAIEQMLDPIYWSTFVSLNGERFFYHGLTYLSPSNSDASRRTWAKLLVRSWNLLDSPQEKLQTALGILQEYDEKPLTATCLQALGWLTYELDQDYLAAIDLYERSLAIYQELNNLSAQSDVLINLGLCRSRLGQVNGGLDCYEKGMALAQQTGDQVVLSISRSLIGENYLIKGKYANAHRNYEDATALTRALESRWGLVWTSAHLGLIFLLEGDLVQARALSRESSALAATCEHIRDKKPAHVLAGLLASVDEEYTAAWRWCEGLDRGENAYGFLIATVARLGLAMAACGLKDYTAAAEQVNYILKHAAFSPFLQVSCVMVCVILLSEANEKARAAELIGLALNHPASPSGWIAHWPQLARLQSTLQAGMTPRAYEAALDRGEELDLRRTTADLIKWLDGLRQPPEHAELPSPAQASAMISKDDFVESLSKRELEVLRLLAAGLSNKEIAERMVVDVSTVKKHLTHIYEKLGITSRTQALVLAQQMNLI